MGGLRVRVLFVVGRELSYARNDVLLRAFRRFAEVTVVAPERAPDSLVVESARVAARAARLAATQRFDLVFVGFYGYLILEALRPFIRAPLLFDAFVSNYDTLVLDRATVSGKSPAGRLALRLDRSACARADHVLVDTASHAEFFAQAIGVARARVTALPVGCNEEIFFPQPHEPHAATRALYYCTYLPLHGVDVVLHAVSYLAAQAIDFRIVGDGPLRPAMETLARGLRLANLRFVDPLPAREIARELAETDICLGGHFGPSAKAQRTVPGKLYQMLAAQRAVIGADSPANRDLLVDGDSALLIPPQDPPALALALRDLHEDPRLRHALAAQGRRVFEERASEAVITARLHDLAESLVLPRA